MDLDAGRRIERRDRSRRALGLGRADPRGRVRDLALEIRKIDVVVIDDAERADTGGREIEQRRAAQPARADHQDARGEQLRLPLLADLVEDQMARIAQLLRLAQLRGHPMPPVEPKPPAPRAVPGKASTSVQATRDTGATTICAMRRPRVIRNGSTP